MSAKDKYAEVRRLKAAMEDARFDAREDRCDRYEEWLTKKLGKNPVGKWLTVNFSENSNDAFPRLKGGSVTLVRARSVVFDYSPVLVSDIALAHFENGKPVLEKNWSYEKRASFEKWWNNGLFTDIDVKFSRGDVQDKYNDYKLQLATKEEICGEAFQYRLRVTIKPRKKDASVEDLFFDTLEDAKKRMRTRMASWRKQGGKVSHEGGRALYWSDPDWLATHEAGIRLVRR